MLIFSIYEYPFQKTLITQGTTIVSCLEILEVNYLNGYFGPFIKIIYLFYYYFSLFLILI